MLYVLTMDFDKWSFEKRKTFLKGLRHKTDDQIYHAFKKEGIELFKGEEHDFLGMTPGGHQYYFAVKPEKAPLTTAQRDAKQKYKHRYILIVRD